MSNQTKLERLKAGAYAADARLQKAWRIAWAHPDTNTTLWNEVETLRKKSKVAYAALAQARVEVSL